MPLQPIGGSYAGPKLTVNMLMSGPTLIQERATSVMSLQLLPDRILRDIGHVDGGLVGYSETTSPYANDDPQIVEEWAEIPVTTISTGTMRAAKVVYRAEGILVSDRERRRWKNAPQQLLAKTDKIIASQIRTWNVAFMNLILANPSIQSGNALASWKAGTTYIRKDIGQAIQAIAEADADTNTGTGSLKLEFDPDTLLVNPTTATSLTYASEINAAWANSAIAGDAPLFKGEFPRTIDGLTVIKSRQVPAGKAIVLQSKVIGGIGDELPLMVKPWYRIEERDTNRTDVERGSVMFMDEPKAVYVINGVDA